jgi:hypothetical protein
LPIDGDAASLTGEVDQERDISGDAAALGLEHHQRQAAGDRRVAALLKHAQPDRGRRVVPRGHHAERAAQHRTGREHLRRLVALPWLSAAHVGSVAVYLRCRH